MKRIADKPFLLFSPFLFFFIIIVIIIKPDLSIGDQTRYIDYAKNIINGHFLTSPSDNDLGNGPGYPLFLVPFILFRLPIVSMTIINAILFYLTIVLLYKVLVQFVSFKIALIPVIYWAFYLNAYENLPLILSETFTIFLVVLLMFTIVRAFKEDNFKLTNKYTIYSGFLFGYLTLTKPIFGYVLLLTLPVSIFLWLTKQESLEYKKTVILLLISLSTTTPYLLYTHNLTGKFFYWSSFGGSNLYWMSTPYEEEFGDWFNLGTFNNEPFNYPYISPEKAEILRTNHLRDYFEISKIKGYKQDEIYRRIAIENIKSHPKKFLINCASNVGRMLFNFPYSYQNQKPTTLLRIILCGPIVLLTIISIFFGFLNWNRINYVYRLLICIVAIYFGGSILGSAETRMVTVVVPILLVWITYILSKSIRVYLRFDKI